MKRVHDFIDSYRLSETRTSKNRKKEHPESLFERVAAQVGLKQRNITVAHDANIQYLESDKPCPICLCITCLHPL